VNESNPFLPLKSLLAELCGGEEGRAEEIVKEYPCTVRVPPVEARRICERLLSYPVRIDPVWFGDFWFLLFSCYADPCRVLDELDRRFLPEHVMEVFASNGGWSRIGYGLGGGLVAEMKLNPRCADEMFEEAERRFAAYRL